MPQQRKPKKREPAAWYPEVRPIYWDAGPSEEQELEELRQFWPYLSQVVRARLYAIAITERWKMRDAHSETATVVWPDLSGGLTKYMTRN
jgi:hypothetical protein